MKPKLRTPILALVAVVALASFTRFLITAGKPTSLPPLPNPNGYDDFVKASSLITGDAGEAYAMETDGLRELVTTNHEALRLVRLGLSRTCRVPTQAALTNNGTYKAELATLKWLALLLLRAEGRLAEMEHRPADAARTYIEKIRFGNEISRGGFIFHRLAGIACEASGNTELVKVVPQLNSEQSLSLVAVLENVDQQAVTWNEVMQGEKVFVRHELRQTFNPIRHVVGWRQNRQILKKAEAKHNLMVALRRLLTTELALCCYQAETGHAPERLDQLVPNYLQCVPTDPFSKHPLIYRAQGTNWLLYSVDRDGMNEGGKRNGISAFGRGTTSDLFFDSLVEVTVQQPSFHPWIKPNYMIA